jgi:hypothetical protein
MKLISQVAVLVSVTTAFQGAIPAQVIAQEQPKRVWLAGIDPVVAADRQKIGMTAALPGPANDFMSVVSRRAS